MTDEMGLMDKLDDYKYAIMYYVYFASCLVVALWLARPLEVFASLI